MKAPNTTGFKDVVINDQVFLFKSLWVKNIQRLLVKF